MTDTLEALVARICSSAGFCRSIRLQRFLRYIAENASAGRTHAVKEYSIGVAVYDKPASFDPQLDPIVRVEAGRLRSRLIEYYAGPGRDDPLIIDLPKGAYLPVVRSRRSAPPTIAGDSIAVIPWRDSSDPDLLYFIDGLAEALTIRFARVAKVRVAPWSMVLATSASRRDLVATADILSARTLLVLSARKIGPACEVHVEWMDAQARRHLWGKQYQPAPNDIASLEDQIFVEVAEQIAPSVSADHIEPNLNRPGLAS